MCNSKSPYVRSKRSWIANVGCGWWCVWLCIVACTIFLDDVHLKSRAALCAFTLLALFREG